MMAKSFRFASTASLAALASMIAGCATNSSHPMNVSSSGFGGRANGDIGLATRAMVALEAKDYAAAIQYAERAVEKTPDDAGFRTLLGNAYFGAGRFASAEAAYKDALAIYSVQPQTVLKLVLAQIAQGKNADALSYLEAAREILDPVNYGLAIALAGRPDEAASLLEAAARVPNATAQTRQNLALAYALTGDWAKARTVAAQDVPANQLDARMQQWMQLAKPARVFDQVATLTGVTPAAVDPGQPVRLALVKPDTKMAQVAPIEQPQQLAEIAPAPPLAAEQQQVAELAPPPENPDRIAAPIVEAAAPVAMAAAAPPPPPAAFEPEYVIPKPHKLRKAAAQVHNLAARPAVLRKGNAAAVVQLGAYGSPQRVLAAWNAAAKRYGSLRGYTPMSARFDGPSGTVYRLAVKGFASVGEANGLCASLRRSGGACFVRKFAGDAPVQIASR